MKDNMKHVCACMLGLVLWCVSTTAHAAVFWDESWEYADNAAWLNSGNWAASSCTAAQHAGVMEISSARAFSGTKSLKFTYIGDNPTFTCFIDRLYGGNYETVYSRVYMFLDNFTASNINTKLYTHANTERIGRYPIFWWSLHQSNNTHRMGVEASPTTNLPFGTFPTGRWVCMETQVTLNTPGVANGIIRSWIDGEPRINRADLVLRNATEVVINGTPPNVNTNGPSNRLQYTRIYRQSGQGVIYWDNFAHGTTRIGCLGMPYADTTPPASPSNFVAN